MNRIFILLAAFAFPGHGLASDPCGFAGPVASWDFARPVYGENCLPLLEVSDKSRGIASRLEHSGYYKRLSRAYRGYPHLRAKRRGPAAGGSGAYKAGFDATARRALRSELTRVARSEELDPKLLDAVIIVESGYNAQAVSQKGAQGLMQLMPATAERFGVEDSFDPAANMRGGARYLRWLMDRFDGKLHLVLAAYNAGEGAVANNRNQIPGYPETQEYVRRVLQVYGSAE